MEMHVKKKKRRGMNNNKAEVAKLILCKVQYNISTENKDGCFSITKCITSSKCMLFIKLYGSNNIISKYMTEKCGSHSKIYCSFCSVGGRFWKNLMFRIFTQKGPWREGEKVGLDTEIRLVSGFTTSSHGGLWEHLRAVYVELNFILWSWPLIGYRLPAT